MVPGEGLEPSRGKPSQDFKSCASSFPVQTTVHPSAPEARSPNGNFDSNLSLIGELYVNGEKVDETEMPQMHISTYSLAETFDVGRDTGTQVSKLYTDPFPFVGELDRVFITLTD